MNYKKFLGAASAALIVIVIFALVPGAGAASKFKTLHKFRRGEDGQVPSGLIFDRAGNLYGTTIGGGAYKRGTVFQLRPNSDGSWTKSALYSFNTDGKDGRYPQASLIFDQAGNLFGTTSLGGAYKEGAVFQLTPGVGGNWRETLLHSFDYTDGSFPSGALIFDAAGKLYGTTQFGGTAGAGTVFQLTRNSDGSWTETLLYNFSGGADGGRPETNLTFDTAGNLYGTTYGDGDLGYGVVFKLTREVDGTWAESVLHSFAGGKDGAYANSGVTFDAVGNLYGTTLIGGNPSYCSANPGCGLLFKLSPNADGKWTEKVLHRFTGGKDGNEPIGDVIFDAAGNLYGTTCWGGTYIYGVVFRLAPDSNGGWRETVLHAFAGHPGACPADVIFDAAGNLYGTTRGEGYSKFGSVFEITP